MGQYFLDMQYSKLLYYTIFDICNVCPWFRWDPLLIIMKFNICPYGVYFAFTLKKDWIHNPGKKPVVCSSFSSFDVDFEVDNFQILKNLSSRAQFMNNLTINILNYFGQKLCSLYTFETERI